MKTVNEVEDGMNSINVDVEELKKERDKLIKEVNVLRQQQWYLETYQRRENLRFYGIPEQLEGKEITRDVLLNFFVNELNIEDARKIEYTKLGSLFHPKKDPVRSLPASFATETAKKYFHKQSY